jgi:ZIP family zinc transporter
MQYFAALHPILQALLATIFTWGMTALGAAAVFSTKNVNRKLLDGLLGFAAGIMIAASFWSLLNPSIELAKDLGLPKWLPAFAGFLIGAGFLFLIDKILPHLHLDGMGMPAEGVKTSWQRSVLLVLAISLHNIPEGMAIGVAFGASKAGYSHATIISAIGLAIGIGLQNLPEGLAVSAPLRREGLSAGKSFFYGQLSAIVEPVSGVIGAAAVFFLQPILPYALSFAAGAMFYVVIEDLLPETQHGENSDIPTLGAVVGFAIMMLLDVALG